MRPILVSIDHNEAMRPRAAKIEQAVNADDHFELPGISGDLPFDLQFTVGGTCPETCNFRGNCEKAPGIVKDCDQWTPRKTIHIEIKDFSEDHGSDYLSSILSGHLWGQCLAARELQEPVVVVVLGDDNDVGAAIRTAASHATAGHRVDPKKLMEYFRIVEAFEANAIALGIQVWRLKTDPYARMLLRVRKILEGGDLSGFAPAPADGERQAVGLSILAGRGVGPRMAHNILNRYNLCLMIRDGYCGDLVDCEGIGPKRAEQIRKNLEVLD